MCLVPPVLTPSPPPIPNNSSGFSQIKSKSDRGLPLKTLAIAGVTLNSYRVNRECERRCGLRRHVAALKAQTCLRTPNKSVHIGDWLGLIIQDQNTNNHQTTVTKTSNTQNT